MAHGDKPQHPPQHQEHRPGRESEMTPAPQSEARPLHGCGKLTERGIRVNAVAPGPIWTPLIPSTFPPEKVARFGNDVPLKRPGQPVEVATCSVFLASEDSSYITGQVLHANGGMVING